MQWVSSKIKKKKINNNNKLLKITGILSCAHKYPMTKETTSCSHIRFILFPQTTRNYLLTVLKAQELMRKIWFKRGPDPLPSIVSIWIALLWPLHSHSPLLLSMSLSLVISNEIIYSKKHPPQVLPPKKVAKQLGRCQGQMDLLGQ